MRSSNAALTYMQHYPVDGLISAMIQKLTDAVPDSKYYLDLSVDSESGEESLLLIAENVDISAVRKVAQPFSRSIAERDVPFHIAEAF